MKNVGGRAAVAVAESGLAERGLPRDELWALLDEARRDDYAWRDGRVPSLLYYAGEDVLEVAQQAYLRFFSENALSPKAFPSLKRLETEILSIAAGLFHGANAVGNLTSGGTESNLLAVKTARDWARAQRPEVQRPVIVAPRTAHPSFSRGAQYFGLEVVRTPVDADWRADVKALRAAVTDDTVLIVGSAPGYTHGVIDPIPELASIAAERGLPCHVDACVGGFFLPFREQLGRATPPFDFRVPGVTSISADLHKFGYTAKGASIVLYRDAELHRYQPFDFDDWPCARYTVPTLTGTRSGGAVAAAWAVLRYLGAQGYRELAERTLALTEAYVAGINRIPGLSVVGEPPMGCFGYTSDTLDMAAVADGLEDQGYYVGRMAEPPGIHLTITPLLEPFVDRYLQDLAAVAERVAQGRLVDQGREARYG